MGEKSIVFAVPSANASRSVKLPTCSTAVTRLIWWSMVATTSTDRPLRLLPASGGFFIAKGLRHIRIASEEPDLFAVARNEIVNPMLVELLQCAPYLFD